MQEAFKFDPKTLKKIGKGALMSFTGAGAIGALTFFGSLEINNPILAIIVVQLVPTMINAIKEWMRGE